VKKGEIQSPAQTGCGKFALFSALGIVSATIVLGYSIVAWVA